MLGSIYARAGAQTILNTYARIDSVINLDNTDVDSIIVTDGSLFAPLDTVLFIQMKGAEILTHENVSRQLWGFIQNINNTGIYSIHLIDRIIGNTVILTSSLREQLLPQKTGEMAQLIKIPGGDVFELSGKYSCKVWDPESGTGGVFALLAGKKIVMNNAIIDVTGKGLNGGNPWVDEYNGNCEMLDSMPFYHEADDDSSGHRGESIFLNTFQHTRGYWYAASGGGGGNGSFSGGGGGSNWGWGGNGGKKADYCPITENYYPGKSGKFIEALYFNQYRLFMGGGGGTGTQRLPDKKSSKGGNGGGIIILISDSLISLGSDTIRANGQSITEIATGSGGGGGGGGIIATDVENYVGAIRMEVRGGDGGSTNDPDTITGPGGFGGAGIIWHKFTSMPSNVTINIDNGEPGIHIPTGQTWGALMTSGKRGNTLTRLNLPIKGFLFNIMPYDQDICQHIMPDTIWASYPKGGNGTFTYKWQQSPDMVTWTNAGPARNDTVYFVPGLLMDTTYYRRIVKSGPTTDTSQIHAINVLPALTNNFVAADDTICMGGSPLPLHHNAPVIGGGNLVDYKYKWEMSPDNNTWILADGTNNALGYAPHGLLDTTLFRRIVISHVCFDTSNVLTITVLDSIRGNTLYQDTSICQYTEPNTIISDLITGGEPGDYRIRWQKSANKLTWTDMAVTTEYYYPGVLNDTVYYRRIIYSGSEDACIDTSNVVSIIVHPVIQGNNVTVSVSNTSCQGEYANDIGQAAGSVSGGDKIYNYTWQSKHWLGTTWSNASGNINQAFYDPGILNDSTFFRRIIISGACKDTSDQVIINVHPMVVNNNISADQTICIFEQPMQLTNVPLPISGGTGSYSFEWTSSSPDSLSWISIGSTGMDFQPLPLSDTTFYKRIVLSGACHDSSNMVSVFVQEDIQNNTVLNGTVDSTCYIVPALLEGTAGPGQMTGGDRTAYAFQWLKSIDLVAWGVAPLTSNLSDYTTEELADSAYFRRIVQSGACRDTSSSTLVRINPRPTGQIIDSTYQSTCYQKGAAAINYDILISLTGKSPFYFISHDGTASTTFQQFNYPAKKTFTVKCTTNDSAKLVFNLTYLSDANGCEAFEDSLKGTAYASIYKIPETKIETESMIICDSTVQLTAIKDVGLGTWSVFEGDNNMNFSPPDGAVTSAETSFEDKDSLFYRIGWTEQNWECIGIDFLDMVLYKQPAPAFAGNDSTVYFADTIRLFAAPPTAGVGVWTLEAGDADIFDINDHASFVDLGSNNLDEPRDYTLRWSINNRTCAPVEDEIVLSRRDIRRYDGFSPDNNLINDFYIVRGLDYADSWKISFYSRHGNLLRQVTSEQGVSEMELWDGKLENGKDVEDGTYYFLIVNKANSSYEYKGTVELARERL